MSELELRELALRLAQEAVEATGQPALHVSPAMLHIVRAAVAHGLRMAETVCAGEHLAEPTDSADDVAYDLAINHCRDALRAKADEMEQSK